MFANTVWESCYNQDVDKFGSLPSHIQFRVIDTS